MQIAAGDYELAYDDEKFNDFIDWLSTCPGICDSCQMMEPCIKNTNSLADKAYRRHKEGKLLTNEDLQKAINKQASIRPPLF